MKATSLNLVLNTLEGTLIMTDTQEEITYVPLSAADTLKFINECRASHILGNKILIMPECEIVNYTILNKRLPPMEFTSDF